MYKEDALKIDTPRILHQIQAGQIPDTWQVLRPRSQVRFATICGAIVFGLGLNFAYLIIGSIILYNTSNQQLGTNPLDIYIHDPLLALLPQLAAIWLTWLFRRRAAHLEDAVLVLLPEGIIQGKSWYDESKRELKVIDYQHIQNMVLKVSRSSELLDVRIATFDLNSPQERMTVPHIFGRFQFDISYKNGGKEIWYVPQLFGRLSEIAQRVVDDYRAFVLVH